jgi:hypothetical protein
MARGHVPIFEICVVALLDLKTGRDDARTGSQTIAICALRRAKVDLEPKGRSLDPERPVLLNESDGGLPSFGRVASLESERDRLGGV